MNQDLQLQAADGQPCAACCARPAATPRAGLVVLQEIFGVNAHIRAVCDRFAADGYLAIAPALFDRAEPGVQLPYGPEGVARGKLLRAQVPDALALRDVAAAVAEARRQLGTPSARVGIVGYCWGGTLAWLAACELPGVDAAVGYYGSGVAGYAGLQPQAPVMLHFGLRDAGIPSSDVEKTRAAHPAVPVYQYDAGHGFNCDDRAAYDAAAATLALERTRAFLAEHLDPDRPRRA